MNDLFGFYCQAFEACGVIIHDSIHFYSGDKAPGWPNGYDLFFLMKVTYKGRTGWFYTTADSCPGCWPHSQFNGYDARWNIKCPKTGKCSERVCHCRFDEELERQCKEEGIPWDLLRKFVYPGYFSDTSYYCDDCGKSILEKCLRCPTCTKAYRDLTFELICQECIESKKESDDHRIMHKLQHYDGKMKEREACDVCFSTFKEEGTVYWCIECTERSRRDCSVEFCEDCSKKGEEVIIKKFWLPEKIVHLSEHELVEIDNPQTYNLTADDKILDELETSGYFKKYGKLSRFVYRHLGMKNPRRRKIIRKRRERRKRRS